MNILFVKDLAQIISQYCPKVYCSLRLVNSDIKASVDQVLPLLHTKVACHSFLCHSFDWCGFQLLDCSYFSLWIDVMVDEFKSKKVARNYGVIAEKFCRDYLPKNRMVAENELKLLCLCNRSGLIRELWNEKRLGSECIRDVGMLEDFEFFKMVHSEVKGVISKDLVKECIKSATDYRRWTNTEYLWRQYSTDDEITSYFNMIRPASGSRRKFLDPIHRSVRDIVLHSVGKKGRFLQFVDKELKKDKEIVLAAVSQCWESLEYADQSLKKDREVVLAAVKQSGLAFRYAHPSMRKDKDLIVSFMQASGRSLCYVDDSFTNDKDVVLAAVTQDWRALQYAGDSLLEDKEFILECLKHNGFAIYLANEFLRKDKEVTLAAVTQNGLALEYVDESFQKDRDIVLAAVKRNGYALEFADESLRNDEEITNASTKQLDNRVNLYLNQ